MTYQLTTALVVIAFVMLAVFGLYLPGHIGHEMGCPFAPSETAMCAVPFAHIQHWQSSFTTILVELLVLAAVIVVFFTRPDPQRDKDPQYHRFRLRQHIPLRPPLFQELFSSGILNRKEPYILVVSY